MREALIGQNSCTGMHTGLETEWFITLSRLIRIENKLKERMVKNLASKLSIEQERLKVGQVKRVTSNNGNTIDSITLLLNDNVEVLFAPNGDKLDFTISNPNIDMSNLDCSIDANVLRDFLIGIKDSYNQIQKNSETEMERIIKEVVDNEI